MASVTHEQILDAAKRYTPMQMHRIDFAGNAPGWVDIDCRICWHPIRPGTPSVDTGYAPFHMLCYARLREELDN